MNDFVFRLIVPLMMVWVSLILIGTTIVATVKMGWMFLLLLPLAMGLLVAWGSTLLHNVL